MLNKKHLLLTVSMAVIAGGVGEAVAGGFALREQSAYYQGLSFAGNAAGGDSLSSMFWNPATVTNAEGFTSESHHSLIIPRVEINPDATTRAIVTGAGGTPSGSGDIGVDAWVPSSYMGYKVNEQLYVGMSINAPYGLQTKPNHNWAGQVYSRTSKIFSINASPTVGYKFNDMISVAVGAQIQYFKISLKRAILPTTGAPSLTLDGDDVGFGVTAGLTITPMEGTAIGLGFRSAVAHTLDGNVTTPIGLAAAAPVAGRYGINASLMTPELVTLSIKQRINDQFRVMGTLEWSNWSRLKAPPVTFTSNGSTLTTLPLNYNDGFYVALGGEYDWNEQLTFRAGAAYEWSPIDTDIRGTRLPDNDRIWVSAGMTYRHNERLSFDLGYTHIFGTDTNINIQPGHQDFAGLPFAADVDSQTDILSASLRYTW